jgi:histidinol-phosphate/aromatic aminotransferase/cobyric acid decarboxylase-like protein/predicted GNAT family N-acyltransferase
MTTIISHQKPLRSRRLGHFALRMAVSADRPAIYRLRHDVYASELGQHPENPQGTLSDALDEFNHYIVACEEGEIVGFVSLTPPGHGRYSVDKYVPRDELPVAADDRLYEVRLLTVAKSHRSSPVTALLMHAALRWIDEQGGRSIVAIGRREVLGLYQKAGFVAAGREIRSGQVVYELMSTDVERARTFAAQHSGVIRRLQASVDWRFEFSLFRIEECEHGGAFFRAIGEDFATLGRRQEIINADVLDAWFPPAPAVQASLAECPEWTMRTSPPTQCEGLVRTISAARGIPSGCIVPGAGSSALIYLVFREWLDVSSRVLLLDPTYGEYAHVLEKIVGCQVDRLRLYRTRGYAVDLAEWEQCLRKDYDLVVLVNPNNPTGRHIARCDLEAVLRRAPARTRYWIDEAYVDYVGPDESVERFAAKSQNVVVCKSLSKACALSGMRAAYLSAPEQIASSLRRISPPWSIGLPSQIAAVRALQNGVYYRQKYAETKLLRGELAEELQRMGLEVIPGTANFLLCHLPEAGPDARTVIAGCQAAGLFLRDVQNMGQELGSYAMRIAVKDADTNQRMLTILARQLEH